jgi:carboxymethylenebutenolidase
MTTAENTITHVYSGTDHHFYDPGLQSFKPSATAIAHTRTTSFLKKHLGGPHFDLERIWDEHCVYEFQERSVAKTMGTMVVSVGQFAPGLMLR